MIAVPFLIELKRASVAAGLVTPYAEASLTSGYSSMYIFSTSIIDGIISERVSEFKV